MSNELAAKSMAYDKWTKQLHYIRTKHKCKDYGQSETVDSLWDKLPEFSKQFWLERVS